MALVGVHRGGGRVRCASSRSRIGIGKGYSGAWGRRGACVRVAVRNRAAANVVIRPFYARAAEGVLHGVQLCVRGHGWRLHRALDLRVPIRCARRIVLYLFPLEQTYSFRWVLRRAMVIRVHTRSAWPKSRFSYAHTGLHGHRRPRSGITHGRNDAWRWGGERVLCAVRASGEIWRWGRPHRALERRVRTRFARRID